MRECVIHGSQIADWDALYTKVANDLQFPEWFGYNLDALFDCLTELGESQITIYRWERLAQTLGERAGKLRKVLIEAGTENPNLIVCLLEEDQDEI